MIYQCHTDFNAIEERHMSVKKGTMLVALSEVGSGNADFWIFGCPDVRPDNFGFVPSNYLTFIKQVNTF